MRGISEEVLKIKLSEIKRSTEFQDGRWQMLVELSLLCTELNPWLPIDEDTPKDRLLLLYYPARYNDDDFDMPKIQSVGYWSHPLGIWVCDLKYCWGEEKSRLVQPTHYQELPEAPL